MSDLKVRPVKIMLDRERNLLIDLNAFDELEAIYESYPAIYRTKVLKDGTVEKTEIIDLVDKAFQYLVDDKRKVRHIKNFLYAGLVYEDASLTPEKIGTMVGWNNVNEMSVKIWEAISGHLPDAKEGSEAKAGE